MTAGQQEQRLAKYDAEIDAAVERELSKPEAQGPLPAEAERVLTGLLANRKSRRDASA
ncbi:MAG: hypothetical protein HOW59_37130 [Nonomuraea sp.]|nr:hypothetical protein [Nonomuraea sp.]NUQ33262.1 hypothetical protein [Dermatophilaceae bacterium]NUR81080.1 hypothetical protein [Dermatophilaceae bacterium]